MATALFINGIYNGVLTEILAAQEARSGGDSFLQPYKRSVIRMLRKQTPTPEVPTRLYISTTDLLPQISYTAEIIGWDDKRKITEDRHNTIRRHLEEHQPNDLNLFNGAGEHGQSAVNIIAIRNLRQMETLFETGRLTKVSDGTPLKKRTRSGGWCEVFDLGDLSQTESKEQHESKLAALVQESFRLSDEELQRRLSNAPKTPEKIQVFSVGFRRNADVIVAVLRRANGVCERCGASAPFRRRTDDSPYLEVHHWIPLSEEGEDSTDNAGALCPNCHREVHDGPDNVDPENSRSH
ncbi:MAG: HNH endonuclease [Planctomycetaceae bacterium]